VSVGLTPGRWPFGQAGFARFALLSTPAVASLRRWRRPNGRFGHAPGYHAVSAGPSNRWETRGGWWPAL